MSWNRAWHISFSKEMAPVIFQNVMVLELLLLTRNSFRCAAAQHAAARSFWRRSVCGAVNLRRVAESETQRNLSATQRRAFLRAVEELCPEVLNALRTDVYTPFTTLFKFARAAPGKPFLVDGGATVYGVWENKGSVDLFATIQWENQLEFTEPDRSGLPRYPHEFAQAPEPKRKAVRDALESWASRFHLESEWVFDEALATMIKWLQQGQKTIDRWCLYSLEPNYSFAELAEPPVLRIEEQWAFEPLSVMRDRVATIRKAFESEVRTYANRIGFSLSKRAPNLREYQWLALARCKYSTTTQILNWHRQRSPARREMPSLYTIKYALKSTAKELGLKPWSRKHGRPPIKKR